MAAASRANPGETIIKDMLPVAQDHYESFAGAGQRYRLDVESKGETGRPFFFQLGMQRTTAKEEDKDKSTKVADADIKNALMNQLMSHNKSMGELLCESYPDMLKAAMAQSQMLAAEVMRLSQMQMKAKEALEDNLDRSAERNEMVKREEASRRRMDSLLDKAVNELFPLIKKELSKKLLPAAKPADPNEDVRQRAEAQAVCRDVFKIIGRDKLCAALPEDHRHLVDDLVGLGTDPKDMADLREKLKALWDKLPQETSDEMQQKMIDADQPDLMLKLIDIAQGK